jgi:hypothetical protein
MAEDGGIPRTTDDGRLADIFPDNTDWVAPIRSLGATLLANGFESGSAAIPHWPMTVRGETSTMYINITSGQHSQAVLPVSMETRSRGVHIEAGEGPRATFFL